MKTKLMIAVVAMVVVAFCATANAQQTICTKYGCYTVESVQVQATKAEIQKQKPENDKVRKPAFRRPLFRFFRR